MQRPKSSTLEGQALRQHSTGVTIGVSGRALCRGLYLGTLLPIQIFCQCVVVCTCLVLVVLVGEVGRQPSVRRLYLLLAG